MYGKFQLILQKELDLIKEAELFKKERVITTAQGAVIKTGDDKEVINFCANNYLGLSAHPRVIKAAKAAMDTHGFGASTLSCSVFGVAVARGEVPHDPEETSGGRQKARPVAEIQGQGRFARRFEDCRAFSSDPLEIPQTGQES